MDLGDSFLYLEKPSFFTMKFQQGKKTLLADWSFSMTCSVPHNSTGNSQKENKSDHNVQSEGSLGAGGSFVLWRQRLHEIRWAFY